MAVQHENSCILVVVHGVIIGHLGNSQSMMVTSYAVAVKWKYVYTDTTHNFLKTHLRARQARITC